MRLLSKKKIRILEEIYEKGELSEEDFAKFLEQSQDSLNILLNNLARASQLISNFKQVAVDQSRFELDYFNIRSYLEITLHSLYPETKRFKLKLDLECDENIFIESFPGALAQVVTNLVRNAMIHGLQGVKEPLVGIFVQEKNEQIEIVFKDNGIGISEESQKKLLSPFSLPSGTKEGRALGSTLSIIWFRNRCRDVFDAKAKLEWEPVSL